MLLSKSKSIENEHKGKDRPQYPSDHVRGLSFIHCSAIVAILRASLCDANHTLEVYDHPRDPSGSGGRAITASWMARQWRAMFARDTTNCFSGVSIS
jgi:hypothetical protein